MLDPAPARLSRDEVAECRERGFLHVRALFSFAETAAIRARVAEHETRDAPVREHLTGGFFSHRGLTLADPELAGLACDGRLLGPAVQMLGPHIRFMGVQSIRREPLGALPPGRTPERPGWHRDIFGMTRDLGGSAPLCAVKCALILSDALEEADGGTRFLPGSPTLDRIAIPSGAIDPVGWVSPAARAGDVVFFGNRTFHAGGLNRSREAYRMILFQYGYRWLAPVVPGCHEDSAIIAALPRLARQLLAPDETVDGEYRPGVGCTALIDWARRHGLCEHGS